MALSGASRVHNQITLSNHTAGHVITVHVTNMQQSKNHNKLNAETQYFKRPNFSTYEKLNCN